MIFSFDSNRYYGYSFLRSSTGQKLYGATRSKTSSKFLRCGIIRVGFHIFRTSNGLYRESPIGSRGFPQNAMIIMDGDFPGPHGKSRNNSNRHHGHNIAPAFIFLPAVVVVLRYNIFRTSGLVRGTRVYEKTYVVQ